MDSKRNAKTHGVNGPRRWVEQRWLLDNIIRTVGIDWDQMRTATCSSPCGPESTADFAAIRQRVQKLDDFSSAFEATARRREARARAHEAEGELVNARNNYFMASIHWGAAQWPIDSNNETNLFYNERKRDCYMRFAKLADRRVEPAWIPFQGKALPGWLHHRQEADPCGIFGMASGQCIADNSPPLENSCACEHLRWCTSRL